MAIDNFRCPSCGADVTFRGNDFINCPYCGSYLHFGEITSSAEIARLRAENSEYERREANKAEYKRKLKSWKRTKWGVFAGLGAIIIVGFLLVTFDYVAIGAPLVILAFLALTTAPALLGAYYPFFDDDKSEFIMSGKKSLSKIFILYGLALVVAAVSVVLAAVISLAMGYESDEEKEEEKRASRLSYAAEYSYSISDKQFYT